ncbi:uncharacterized protein LOC131949210 [Physella acuta]|uniref:uncharacterized protein LOC131949210 n=1 Tax=Physella acuta TaxID=109671 RepID=UPI0027DCD6DD|nr:uncharacterized protein LOC131949210 [Physella acuta]XP_059166985.1 uncharacterized protein LOC131949210 [Physella acuta]
MMRGQDSLMQLLVVVAVVSLAGAAVTTTSKTIKPPKGGVCKCPLANRQNLPFCDLNSRYFLGKRSCCDPNSSDNEKGKYYCIFNDDNNCECVNVPAVDYCYETKGTYQVKEECCNGQNPKGAKYKCAYEVVATTKPTPTTQPKKV